MVKRGISSRFFKLGNVLEETLRLIESFPNKGDIETDEPNTYEVFVFEVSPGSAGVHQADEVMGFFDLSAEAGYELEEKWEEIDRMTDKVAEDINNILKPMHPPKYQNGHYNFGTTEGGNDYGLFFRWSEPLEPGKEEAHE